MRIFIYIMILAAVAMLYKTFYWDYQKKEIVTEVNTSVEASEVSETESVTAVRPIKNETSDEANRTGWQSRKGMPIDRLGDSIGNSLKDKIKVQ